MKLTWADLIIDFTNLNVLHLYESWNWLLDGKFRPIMMSTFGDLFYQKEDGKIYYLDTIEGHESCIADSEKGFVDFINVVENQENYLLSFLVFELKDKGLNITENQCYGFKIAPILGGKIEFENVEVMDLAVWLHIIGQIHFQVKDLPEGTEITEFKIIE